jgi:hypothetical protein
MPSSANGSAVEAAPNLGEVAAQFPGRRPGAPPTRCEELIRGSSRLGRKKLPKSKLKGLLSETRHL